MTASPVRPITEEEIRTFEVDGAVLLKGVLPIEWINVAAQGLDEAIATPDVMSEELDRLRVDQFPAARSDGLRQLVHHSPLAEIVGTALASPVSFYMDQLFHKPAGPVSPTAWHQDTCYYNVAGNDLVRAWVSPDPVPRQLSLEVVRGSHRWNATYRPLAGRNPRSDESAEMLAKRRRDDQPMIGAEAYEDWSYWLGVQDTSLPNVPDIESQRDSFDIVGWDYEPGDVILFHGHILHGARGGVEWPQERRAHASLWAGSDVHYLHRVGQIIPDPFGLYDHQPKSGQLLSEFDDVFPVLWSPSPG